MIPKYYRLSDLGDINLLTILEDRILRSRYWYVDYNDSVERGEIMVQERREMTAEAIEEVREVVTPGRSGVAGLT